MTGDLESRIIALEKEVAELREQKKDQPSIDKIAERLVERLSLAAHDKEKNTVI